MPQRPNVLILVIDTARAQNFSCYGYGRATSPNIDAFAAESVLYEHAIATGCWSLPSQLSLLTGLFPSKHGAHELHLAYPHHYPTLPEVLRQEGYRTLGVSPNSWMSDEFGTTYGFDTYLKLWQCWRTMPAAASASTGPLVTLAKQVNRLYGRYLFPRRNRARHVNQHLTNLLASTAEPFFLYAIYWDMHLPYYPHGEHAARWLPQSATASRVQQVNRNALAYFTGQTSMTEEDFAILLGNYDGALATIDAEIGALLTMLRQRNLLDNTLVVITSDHGENIGDHNLMSHAYSLHDTLIRVPLLIRYPGGAYGGTRVVQQVQPTDLFPTILDCLELERPDIRQELQGVSLLEAPSNSVERPAYAEMLAPHPSMQSLNRRTGLPADTAWPQYDRALRCLRTPESKLIWASDGHHALYDLHHDPGETTNRFTTESERAQALMDMLMAWQPPTGVPLCAPTPELDPDVRQRLRALGYVD